MERRDRKTPIERAAGATDDEATFIDHRFAIYDRFSRHVVIGRPRRVEQAGKARQYI